MAIVASNNKILSGEIVGYPIRHRPVDEVLPGLALPVQAWSSSDIPSRLINVVVGHDLIPPHLEPGMIIHATGRLREIKDSEMDLTYYDFQCRSLTINSGRKVEANG